MRSKRWLWLVGVLVLVLAAGAVARRALATPNGVGLVKASVPPSGTTVSYGEELMYSLVFSAPAGAVVHIYDPLDPRLAWEGFVSGVPDGVVFDEVAHAVTGTLTMSETMWAMVAFRVRVGVGAPGTVIVGTSALSNTAYLYLDGETVGVARPSNVVHHTIRRVVYYLHMPIILRSYPVNRPPYIPSQPEPADGAVDQTVNVTLRWVGGDPDGEAVTYDVYLDAGDGMPTTLVCDDVASPTCSPSMLAYDTHYVWRVVATDARGESTEGPVWGFTTLATPPPAWFTYVNGYRAGAGLPPVEENGVWSYGCWLHARYMVKNDYIGHDEDPANPWYTSEGDAAAGSSNVMVHSSVYASDELAIDLWMQGPFHAVGIIDPALHTVGFGSYREADGGWQMGAALDVLRGLGSVLPGVRFPVYWPKPGGTMPLLSYGGGEVPDPLSACPGYTAPSGPPIILQLGAGEVTPQVTAHAFSRDGVPLEHCVFDETSYTNPTYQALGRAVLDGRDAVVLMPRDPLEAGAQYVVSITANGTTYVWTFTTAPTARRLALLGEGVVR